MTNESKFLLAKCLIETDKFQQQHPASSTLDAMIHIFQRYGFATSTTGLFVLLLNKEVKEQTLEWCNTLLGMCSSEYVKKLGR